MDVEFSTIRNTPQVKEVFEALLIDSTTPEEVYMELFGISMAGVTKYKSEYSGPWDKPRMFCYAHIITKMKGRASDLALKVFNGGWQVLDSLFNSGKNINTAEMSMQILRIIAGRAGGEATETGKLNHKLIAAAKNMVAAVQQNNQIEGASTDEAWDFMIKELADKERSATMPLSIQDAYKQVTKAMADKNKEGTDDKDLV